MFSVAIVRLLFASIMEEPQQRANIHWWPWPAWTNRAQGAGALLGRKLQDSPPIEARRPEDQMGQTSCPIRSVSLRFSR